ncbi:hypothetical protein ACTFIZ_002055 [Dictyostelium cf. discoideum]
MTRGVVAKGNYCTNKTSISETYNGFFTIGLNGCKYKMRDETNNTEDFIIYLHELLATGFIKKDSFLVMDNSPIHGGIESSQLIEELLGKYSIKLVFLPVYSPECNPIERLFAYIKNHFYNDRHYEKQFLDEIIETNLIMLSDMKIICLLVFIAKVSPFVMIPKEINIKDQDKGDHVKLFFLKKKIK